MPKADLVLEGGGVKGIALVGAIAVLEEHGYTFNRIAGTSAGSIVGSMVAAGMSSADLIAVMQSLDYSRFQDKGREDRLPGGLLYSLLKQQGIYEGAYLKDWLAEILEGHGVRTFADLRYDDAGTLPPEERYRLVVMASDVSTGRLRRLPWDYPALGYEPDDVRVVDAVRASMSLPFFFEPVKMTNRMTEEEVWMVDGGMLSNFPVEVFDRTPGKPPRWPTIGIKLSARRGSQTVRYEVNNTFDLARSMLATMANFHDQIHVDDAKVVARTIFIDTLGVKSTEFGLTRATADQLYENGRAAAEDFLSKWDFDAYVQLHRSSTTVPEDDSPKVTAAETPVER